MKAVNIENFKIDEKSRPFIIAELSGNHNQSLDRAFKIIDAASEAGADALKLQTYTADTLTINHNGDDFYLNDKNSIWHGRTMYDLYQEAHTPWDWHKSLFDYCKSKNIICFSTPFDDTSVDFLEKLDCPAYKIASTENTDTSLLKKVANTGKPVIVSLGMATIEEIGIICNVFQQAGNSNVIFLKCTAAYPAEPSEANLKTLPHLADLTGCWVGLSDHSMGIGVAVASIPLGAKVIEKHLTLSRKDGGVDSSFSMEPSEMKSLVDECKRAHLAMGNIKYGVGTRENANLSRRSLYVVEDIKKGEKLTSKNLRSIRPGYGLPARYIDIVMGAEVSSDIKKGTRLTWDIIKK